MEKDIIKIIVDFLYRSDGGLRAFSADLPALVLSSTDIPGLKSDVKDVIVKLLIGKYDAEVEIVKEEFFPLLEHGYFGLYTVEIRKKAGTDMEKDLNADLKEIEQLLEQGQKLSEKVKGLRAEILKYESKRDAEFRNAEIRLEDLFGKDLLQSFVENYNLRLGFVRTFDDL